VTYALGQWEQFRVFLDDGAMEIDNNLIENEVRPLKLGLKNYLFFGSAEAGENNAILYTLLGNCAAHGIDPETYLAEALRRLPADATHEQATELTPAKLADELRPPERKFA
jgi:transposase